MPRGPAKFTQSDVTRAIKAARAAGLESPRVEIAPDGTIIIGGSQQSAGPFSPYDEWKAKVDARSS